MIRSLSALALSVLVAFAASAAHAGELELGDDYLLPVFVPIDSSMVVDTPFCPDGELKAAGWIHVRLRRLPEGGVKLIAGIPTHNGFRDQCSFCGIPLVTTDEGAYSTTLSAFQDRGGVLVMAFDVPLVDEDVLVILWRGKPRFEVHFGDQHLEGKAMPSATAFRWRTR